MDQIKIIAYRCHFKFIKIPVTIDDATVYDELREAILKNNYECGLVVN
jgi:hypothetical protein